MVCERSGIIVGEPESSNMRFWFNGERGHDPTDAADQTLRSLRIHLTETAGVPMSNLPLSLSMESNSKHGQSNSLRDGSRSYPVPCVRWEYYGCCVSDGEVTFNTISRCYL